MLVDKQNELISDLLFTVHQHGGDDVTWKPPILTWSSVRAQANVFLAGNCGSHRQSTTSFSENVVGSGETKLSNVNELEILSDWAY